MTREGHTLLLPREVIDSHHHFIDTANTSFQSFLRLAAGGDISSLPEDYTRDVIAPLSELGVHFYGSVHVEAMPDSGSEEVAWVEEMSAAGRCTFVKAYVASCDLTRDNVSEVLQVLAQTSRSKLRGIRWILDCVGKFHDGETATHVATSRHDGIDYLKAANFERGLALLETNNLSFDLQCAPIQLVESAALLFSRYPHLKVCIDHLGKPRRVLGDDLMEDGVTINSNIVPDEKELGVWRKGMKAMSALPNVYVKLSMMGYAIPGWIRTKERQVVLKSLVRETIDMFGVERCMVAWNWHVNAAVSDGDGGSKVGPDAVDLLKMFVWFFEGYSEEQTEALFCGTAKQFYQLE
jgi:predicted TIM-barrel fold metal-dependent hydrolase